MENGGCKFTIEKGEKSSSRSSRVAKKEEGEAEEAGGQAEDGVDGDAPSLPPSTRFLLCHE